MCNMESAYLIKNLRTYFFKLFKNARGFFLRIFGCNENFVFGICGFWCYWSCTEHVSNSVSIHCTDFYRWGHGEPTIDFFSDHYREEETFAQRQPASMKDINFI